MLITEKWNEIYSFKELTVADHDKATVLIYAFIFQFTHFVRNE